MEPLMVGLDRVTEDQILLRQLVRVEYDWVLIWALDPDIKGFWSCKLTGGVIDLKLLLAAI